jgi:3-methyladenine DNA glycosylase Tag
LTQESFEQIESGSAVSNAIAFMEIQKEFGSFSNYIWAFTMETYNQPPKALINSLAHFLTPLAQI